MPEHVCNNLFVFQALDHITQTVCVEWRVQIDDQDQLRSILAPKSEDDPALEYRYDGLSRTDICRIGNLCLPPIVPDSIFTAVCGPIPAFDEIPYLIHTTFELPLMLEGRKPLAVFGDGYPSEWFDEFLAPFEPFVASGISFAGSLTPQCPTSSGIDRTWKGCETCSSQFQVRNGGLTHTSTKSKIGHPIGMMILNDFKARCLATKIGKMIGGSSSV